MTQFKPEKGRLSIVVDTSSLSGDQVRLIKTLNTLLNQVLTTSQESQFFDGSAEFLRLCASAIQQANFTKTRDREDKIPYATQALEYSMDILQDHMSTSKIVKYDN